MGSIVQASLNHSGKLGLGLCGQHCPGITEPLWQTWARTVGSIVQASLSHSGKLGHSSNPPTFFILFYFFYFFSPSIISPPLVPPLQMWDLRNATAPMRTLEHHRRGVLSLAWCPQDSDLLLSASKDNCVYCWNPNSEVPGGEVCHMYLH